MPFEFVHQTVQVKFSDKLVIILNDSATKTLATHVRQAKFKNSILPAHLPPNKIQLSNFDVKRVQKFAELIGPKMRAYVDWQFEEEQHPLRALRRMLGLLRFYETKRPSSEAMEYAANLAQQFTRKDLRFFQDCATNFQHNGKRLHIVSPPQREKINIHIRSPKGE